MLIDATLVSFYPLKAQETAIRAVSRPGVLEFDLTASDSASE